MNRQALKSEIKEYLELRGDVIFAYVFGSFVQGESYRDIDIALYMNAVPELIQLGIMRTKLTELIEEQVDLLLLNNLPAKSPALAYEVVTGGELLLSSDPDKHTEYKRNALLRYFDTARLREQIDRAFSKRVEENKFGRRNYD